MWGGRSAQGVEYGKCERDRRMEGEREVRVGRYGREVGVWRCRR